MSLAKKRLLPLLLVCVACLAYANSLSAGFVWDDKPLIAGRQGFFANAKNALRLVTRADFDDKMGLASSPYYRPLGTLSFMADHYLWGLDPFWYHLENVLLHALAVLLFYLLLAEVFKDRRLAFFSALLFALYPVNTEAVDFISARNTLFCAVFCLASLLCLEKGFGFFSRRWTVAALVLFFLALMSKEPAVAVPFFLLSMALAPGEGKEKFKVEKGFYFFVFALAGFFALLGLYFLVRLEVLGAFTSREGIRLSPDRLKLVASVYFENFRLMLYPFKLNAFYAGGLSFGIFKAAGALSGLLLLLFLSIAKRVPGPLRAGAQWIFWGLLPVSNIVKIPSAPVAERYLYMIVPGAALMAGYALAALYKKRRQAGVAAVLLLCVPMGARTFARNFVWHDNLSLYKSMVRSDFKNSWAHCDLGVLYADRNDNSRAMRELQTATSLEPGNAAAHMDLGTLYLDEGRLREAVGELSVAVKLIPRYADAHLNLGMAYRDLGLRGAAAREFQTVLALDPDSGGAREQLEAIDGGKTDP